MKNLSLVGAERRYRMSPRAFEKFLEELGWLKEGQICAEAVEKGYVTAAREITPMGRGYFSVFLEQQF